MEVMSVKQSIRCTVSKKGVLIYLRLTIFYNAVAILLLAVFLLMIKKEAYEFAIIISIFTLTLDFLFLYQFQMLGSMISFENDVIKCTFLKRKRRIIRYDEIKDYGSFWEKGIKFIYISKFVLTEFQREEKAFELYKKTKDVIVLQYNDDVINLLDSKC